MSVSKESPLLVFIDDLNWADDAFIQLLHFFARKIKGLFISILCTYRDVELQDESSLSNLLLKLNRERLLTTVRLKRFDSSNVARMIAETFGETEEQQTSEFRNLLYEKTGGNPFFIEEVLRSLVEQGMIFRTEKGWTRKSISDIEIPSTS